MENITKNNHNSLFYLITFPLFMGLGFSTIIKTVGSDVWICSIIGTIMGLIINYIICKLPEYSNKYISIVYNGLLILLATLIITRPIYSIYLNLTPNYFVIIPFLLIVFYSCFKDKFTINRASNIFLVIVIGFALLSFISLFNQVNIDYFLPICTSSTKNILIGSLDFALISTCPNIALPNFKNNYNYKIYLLSAITFSLILIYVVGVLSPNLAASYRYPEYIVFKKIAVLSFLENIENILFLIWVITSFILSYQAGLNIKEKTNNKILFIILLIIFIIINYIIMPSFKINQFIVNYYQYILIGLFILFFLSKIFIKKAKD